mmetsp:Transcript_92042/g.281704  ORF Transcript_92042/g.281704 Transcript_92042/m.281704 type:complete len:372 (-) Transcript_92042:342-1457(-)
MLLHATRITGAPPIGPTRRGTIGAARIGATSTRRAPSPRRRASARCSRSPTTRASSTGTSTRSRRTGARTPRRASAKASRWRPTCCLSAPARTTAPRARLTTCRCAPMAPMTSCVASPGALWTSSARMRRGTQGCQTCGTRTSRARSWRRTCSSALSARCARAWGTTAASTPCASGRTTAKLAQRGMSRLAMKNGGPTRARACGTSAATTIGAATRGATSTRIAPSIGSGASPCTPTRTRRATSPARFSTPTPKFVRPRSGASEGPSTKARVPPKRPMVPPTISRSWIRSPTLARISSCWTAGRPSSCPRRGPTPAWRSRPCARTRASRRPSASRPWRSSSRGTPRTTRRCIPGRSARRWWWRRPARSRPT